MKFDDIPFIDAPNTAPAPAKSHDLKVWACKDCGKPVRHSVKRCRECYLDNALARSHKYRPQALPDEPNNVAFVRMDDKFQSAMRRAIDAGLEKP